jgi:hypothetical protein
VISEALASASASCLTCSFHVLTGEGSTDATAGAPYNRVGDAYVTFRPKANGNAILRDAGRTVDQRLLA